MPMFLKSYTISNRFHMKHSTNGVETGVTRYSEEGVRAELLLTSASGWKAQGKADIMQLSVTVDVEGLPDMSGAEFKKWLRDQIIEMMADKPIE